LIFQSVMRVFSSEAKGGGGKEQAAGSEKEAGGVATTVREKGKEKKEVRGQTTLSSCLK